MPAAIIPWLRRYKTEASGAEHIGPMAQDFYAAFGLGDSDKHIVNVDADGVALAAIRGLHAEAHERDEKITRLEADNAALRERLDAVEARVDGRAILTRSATGLMPWLAGGSLAAAGLLFRRRRS